jgi:hypothetical protein
MILSLLMFKANDDRPYRADDGGRYHQGCARHHYRAALFQFAFPAWTNITREKMFADEKMVDFILVLCYKMSANKNKCRHIVTGFDKI